LTIVDGSIERNYIVHIDIKKLVSNFDYACLE